MAAYRVQGGGVETRVSLWKTDLGQNAHICPYRGAGWVGTGQRTGAQYSQDFECTKLRRRSRPIDLG
jgi:hypothetical protein